MHICSNCGKEFEGNFCPECGQKWEDNSVFPDYGKDLTKSGESHETVSVPANVGVLKKVFNILPVALLGVAVIICFGLFAAPVAVDVIGESQGSIYGALLSTGDEVVSVAMDIKIINAACMLVLFTALCAVFTLCAVGALIYKPLHKSRELFGIKFTLYDLVVAIARVLMIVVFELSRVLWSTFDGIMGGGIMGGGLGLFKEGGCTLGVSVVSAIFFFLSAGSEVFKLVLSKKYPTEERIDEMRKERFMSTIMMWFAVMFSILCFAIFLFPISVTADGENMGSLLTYFFRGFGGDNFYKMSDVDSGNVNVMFGYIFLQSFSMVLPLYMIMIIVASLIYLIGGNTRRMDKFSYTTIFVSALAVVLGAANWAMVPEGYSVGIGTVTLTIVSAIGFVIQIAMLVSRRKYADKKTNES